jgi:hypothetical protein
MQQVQQQHYKLTNQSFEYRQAQEIFLFSKTSSPALEFTQHPNG